MVQRVGIAQALINDPEVVFLDEPMSGLDPIGRREVRELILSLRDRGVTVFFSSHVLADAEALCNRVAIVAKGRLAAAGRLSDLNVFQVRGWELVVTGLDPARLDRMRAQFTRVTELGERQYSLELPASASPEQAIMLVVNGGARVTSLTPVRDTLEDFFVKHVQTVEHDRGLAVRAAAR
jgi:ABC-2 type transport system ATP-binding protein